MTRLGLFAACTLSAAGLGLAAGGAIYATQGPGRFPGPGFPDGPLAAAPTQDLPATAPAPAAEPGEPAEMPPQAPPAGPDDLPDGGPPPLPPDVEEPRVSTVDADGPLVEDLPSPAIAEEADTPPAEFVPPSPPDGQAWSKKSVFDPQTGRMRTAYVLVSVPPPILPQENPPTAIPPPAAPPVVSAVPPTQAPPASGPIPRPSEPQFDPLPDFRPGNVAGSDYSAYLDRTRKEVQAAVNQLAREEGELNGRLRQTQENLRRLQRLQQVLEAEEPGLTPGPRVSRRPAPDMPQELYPADTPDLIPYTPDGPNLVPSTSLIPNMTEPLDPPHASPAPDDRLQSLESKLERLLESVDGLRREVETLKERREPEIPADMPRPSSS